MGAEPLSFWSIVKINFDNEKIRSEKYPHVLVKSFSCLITKARGVARRVLGFA